MQLKDKHFLDRISSTDKRTYALMILLEKYDHWTIENFPTLEEDKKGVDLWVSYDNIMNGKTLPIQFKIREGGRKDFIISRYQPCWGLDLPVTNSYNSSENIEQTVNGRDWRNLQENNSTAYYIATTNKFNDFTDVSYVTCKALKKAVQSLNNDWEASGAKEKYTNSVIKKMLNVRSRSVFNNEYGDVFFQKNKNESPKFLMYINNNIRQGNIEINKSMQKELREIEEDYVASIA